MRLRTKILITYCLFFIPAFYYLTADFQKNLKFRYLEGVEEALVDQAGILAAMVARDMARDSFSPDDLAKTVDAVYDLRFRAGIYQLLKTHVDTRIYITDQNGILLFDSMRRDPPGTDYSRWRDVLLTLQGVYGARSTRDDPQRPAMSTLYVAAPITLDGTIKGVLTVGKPTANINDFIAMAKSKVVRQAIIAAVLALLLSILTMFFITRPLDHLTRYVDRLREGKTAEPPRFGNSDIGQVGRAVEKIHADLATKQYIEEYVQSLTHEIKSPVAAIAGASELLEEKMPEAQRQRFVANIRAESKRIQDLVDRMLALSSLEHRNGLEKRDPVDLKPLVKEVLDGAHQKLADKGIQLSVSLEDACETRGDGFLLKQALVNLCQNALDFSPHGGEIGVVLKKSADRIVVRITDQGPGIPGFAREKIFDRFFSMQRPDTGKKSTGLGLNFTREIALLHGGGITVDNAPGGGASAVLTLPKSPLVKDGQP